jgi:hypothetical protein
MSGFGGMELRVLNDGTRWRWMLISHRRDLLPRRETAILLNWRQSETQSQSWHRGKVGKHFTLPKLEMRVLSLLFPTYPPMWDMVFDAGNTQYPKILSLRWDGPRRRADSSSCHLCPLYDTELDFDEGNYGFHRLQTCRYYRPFDP